MKTTIRIFLFVSFILTSFISISQSNQYLHFDRQNDWVGLEEGSKHIANSTSFSMAGWFFTDALVYGQGMMGFRGADQGFYLIQLNKGIIECRLSVGGSLYEYVAPAYTVVPQTWQHYAWVYSGSEVKLYVDGNLKGSSFANGQFTDKNIKFTIGRSILSNLDFYYGGRADEVSVWNKALTKTDIQDMMENELTGSEEGLQVYYKFNQGEPGGDNTSITKLLSEVGGEDNHADLYNFAMNGETSNFNGSLIEGYQAISFPQIPNKLTTDNPFNLDAISTSGLEVVYEIESGPAIINGKTIILNGQAGEVIVKANQPGNNNFDPAAEVINSFNVIDPSTHVPDIDATNPLAGDVIVPQLTRIPLSAKSSILYPELFNVQNLEFVIDGNTIPAFDHGNGHYTAWWEPPAFGNYKIEIKSTSNFSAVGTKTINIGVIDNAIEKNVLAFENVLLNTSIASAVVEAELPSYQGAYNEITATLDVTCPTGGCGEWDRVASIDAKGHDGNWVEIIRYITPYGVPCSHTVDLSDYMSILQGKIEFRANCGTFDNGYEYNLSLNYKVGTPDYQYSSVRSIWQDIYPFGDYANLQPVEKINWSFPDGAVSSKLKIMNTGHGWGDLNTGNAAEFYEATHKIMLNGNASNQHLWAACNPNPDGCQPQNGTWYYDRAGWCPGAISNVYDFDLSPYISSSMVDIEYEFYPSYIDLCHPNHPNCVTGVTCTNCDDGFNPHYIITGNVITYSNSPIVSDVNEIPNIELGLEVFPNPTTGPITITMDKTSNTSQIQVFDIIGNKIIEFEINGNHNNINLSAEKEGIYILKMITGDRINTKRIIKL